MKPTFILLAAAAALFTGTAVADEHEYEHRESREHISAKFYGVVDALPQNSLAGTWIVNGRQVMVRPGTEIKEKHGRLAVGSYVKVEGYPAGTTFAAYEIEVKSKRH